MNSGRKNFIQGVATGILLCIIGAGAYFYVPSLFPKSAPRDVSLEKSLEWIRNKDIKTVVIKQENLELTDTQGEKFVAMIGESEQTRQMIFQAAKDTGTTIKIEPTSSGRGWFYLIQLLPLILLGMFAICTASLAILAYKALFNKRVD
jgi:ATP-dependent Zn protease